MDFDISGFVECAEIPAQQPAKNKIIEVLLKPTADLKSGKVSDLAQVTYRALFVGGAGEAAVTDFAPKTTLYSEVEDAITLIQSEKFSISGNLSANYFSSSQAKGVLEAGRVHESQMQYKRLPPKKVFVASGTFDGGKGAFFKFHPSEYTTFEGQQSFSCLISVPAGWRVGFMDLNCEASAYDRGLFSDSEVKCANKNFRVALYLKGDEEAEKAARNYIKASEALLKYQVESLTESFRKIIEGGNTPKSEEKFEEELRRNKEKAKELLNALGAAQREFLKLSR